MEVQQIYQLVNNATESILGETAVLSEDLSNIVDIGTSVFNSNAVDNYVHSLLDHIGRMVFVNRPYSGGAPSVLMDAWEYGSVLEKVRSEMPEATENETWELVDGQSYDPNIFYQPQVSAKFFNKRVTFEVPRSITEKQVKESFSNREQYNAFVSMLYNDVDKAMTVRTDSLIMRTINNMIGETLYDFSSSGAYGGSTSATVVNLLYEYNTKFSASLTPSAALTEPAFLRYASMRMSMYITRMSKISSLFNIGQNARFTPSELLHVVLLDEFASAADVYLQSNTFHNNFTELPNHEIVPFWQGSGLSYNFTDTSSINIKTASGHDVSASGIIGVMFDRDALGVSNYNRRVTSQYNGKAEFFNNWFKMDAGYFNDMDENFVVFIMAYTPPTPPSQTK